MFYEIYLPFPPTVNSYYVKTRNGVFISKKGKLFREQVAESIVEQLPDTFIQDRMLVEVILYPPDKRVRDLGNYDKALMDAITEGGLWEDDELIDQQFFYRGCQTKGGLTYMRIGDAGPILQMDQRPPD